MFNFPWRWFPCWQHASKYRQAVESEHCRKYWVDPRNSHQGIMLCLEGKYRKKFQLATGLAKRGVQIDEIHCGLCLDMEEIAQHVFITCSYARVLWEWILKWCHVNFPRGNSVGDITKFARSWGQCARKWRIMTCICYGMITWLWKARCERLFKKIRILPTMVVDNIQSMVFVWLKHRILNYPIKWTDWSIYPFWWREENWRIIETGG